MHFAGSNGVSRRYPEDATVPRNGAWACSPVSFVLASIGVGLAAAISFQFACGDLTITSLFLKLFMYVSFVVMCLSLGSYGFLSRKSPLKLCSFDTSKRSSHLLNLFNEIITCEGPGPVQEPGQLKRAVVSHGVDKAMKEVFDYGYRDYVLSWYSSLSQDEGRLHQMLLEDFWELLKQLRGRVAEVDTVKVVCSDVVKRLHVHFCDLRAANGRLEEDPRPFLLHPCLRSPQAELAFLRCCGRLMLLYVLPARDVRSHSLRLVLSEVIAIKVLKPLVDLLSDPDYINRTLLTWLEQREQLLERHRKAYTYAPSYEEFIKLISSSSDVEFLQQLRYQIVMEIIQATTISNLPNMKKSKDSKGRDKAMKTDLLRARNMKRYVNQLTVAKRQCEKRIWLLGGPCYEQQEDGPGDEAEGSRGPRILQFEEIMANPAFRGYFRVYMERVDKRALICFWEQVETLKNASKCEVPQLVGEIYQNFFVESREIPVEKALMKEIQQTLVGNKGTEVFRRLQGDVYESMKERYYPSFLVSDLYEGLIKREQNSTQPDPNDKESPCQTEEGTQEVLLDDGGQGINEQASYAASRLSQLHERLEYKRQALGSIQNSPKPDKKIVCQLREEIGSMEREHTDLQQHISRTDYWCENLGLWTAAVTSGEAVEENGELTACYCVCVSLPDKDNATHSRWAVTRKLSEFQALHKKLLECFPTLKKVTLPSVSKLPFKSIDQKFLEKSRCQLNSFLQRMLADERLCQSEALYAFLSPAPEHLKMMDVQKKPSFSLTAFLDKLPKDLFPSHQEEEGDEDSDVSDYGDETDGKRDALAEPLFMLIGEIFELKGMFKWVRRTLIALVQVTYGRTINKQIRDTVGWICSEPMLLYYISVVKDTLWPDGKLASLTNQRSEAERRATRERAQKKLLDSVPDVLQSLVGQQNARHGVIKVFNALQETRANKHLLYVLLELCLREMCPELTAEMAQV